MRGGGPLTGPAARGGAPTPEDDAPWATRTKATPGFAVQ